MHTFAKLFVIGFLASATILILANAEAVSEADKAVFVETKIFDREGKWIHAGIAQKSSKLPKIPNLQCWSCSSTCGEFSCCDDGYPQCCLDNNVCKCCQN